MPKIIALSRVAADCGVNWNFVKSTAEQAGIGFVRLGNTLHVAQADHSRLLQAVSERKAQPKPQRKSYGTVPSQVYFISSGAYVKIGVAMIVRSRLCELQVGNPEKLEVVCTILGDAALESDLHDYFSHLHVRGDWFRHEDDLRELTDCLGSEPDYLAASRVFDGLWNRVRRSKSRGKSQTFVLPLTSAKIIQLRQGVTE